MNAGKWTSLGVIASGVGVIGSQVASSVIGRRRHRAASVVVGVFVGGESLAEAVYAVAIISLHGHP